MADLVDYSDAKVQKMEVDYSATCDIKIPECESLAKVMIKLVLMFFCVCFSC
jgi:hypothetical protein